MKLRIELDLDGGHRNDFEITRLLLDVLGRVQPLRRLLRGRSDALGVEEPISNTQGEAVGTVRVTWR